MRRFSAVLVAAVLVGLGASPAFAHRTQVSVFAAGFNNPRGLTFGPDGGLYVAEGGLGGDHSTVGSCPQASGAAAPYTGSTNDPVRGGRISRVGRAGLRTTVVRGLPSSETNAASGKLVSGVSSVAFLGHKLYALLAGAGCSHGVPTVPNGVLRVDGGHARLIADLSAFQAAHPVAAPDEDDFEPDGTWFSMIAFGGALYPMDSNHGELDRVTPSGRISRVVDISAQLGHIVPTALVERHGRLLISNLGLFDPGDGAGDESVLRLGRRGAFEPFAGGVEKVVGLARRHGALYALELSTSAGGPTPGTGALVRVHRHRAPETIVDGLTFPTGLTAGPDGALYVSDQGFGFGAGAGRILRIRP